MAGTSESEIWSRYQKTENSRPQWSAKGDGGRYYERTVASLI